MKRSTPAFLSGEWFSIFSQNTNAQCIKRIQRVRYFGLQHTASFKKWYEVIAKLAGDLVDAMVSYAKRITYAEFFEEIANRNPLDCQFCGNKMELTRLFHPTRGLFFDLFSFP